MEKELISLRMETSIQGLIDMENLMVMVPISGLMEATMKVNLSKV
jgi:hypothetical protein